MRIDSSAVGMKSDRAYGKYEQKKTSSLITTKNKADSLELSDESKSLVEQLEEGKVQLKEKQEKQQKQNIEDLLARHKEQSNKVENEEIEYKSPYEIKLEALKRMLEALKRMKKSNLSSFKSELQELQMQYKSSFSFSVSASSASSITNMNQMGSGNASISSPYFTS